VKNEQKRIEVANETLGTTYKHGNLPREDFPNRGAMKWFKKCYLITNIFS
jgi:hypothetical protein